LAAILYATGDKGMSAGSIHPVARQCIAGKLPIQGLRKYLCPLQLRFRRVACAFRKNRRLDIFSRDIAG
jgi:hypothetical protein